MGLLTTYESGCVALQICHRPYIYTGIVTMVWQQVIQRFKNKNKRTTDRKRRRRLMMESLTKRELLASDFAAITGTVFDLSLIHI